MSYGNLDAFAKVVAERDALLASLKAIVDECQTQRKVHAVPDRLIKAAAVLIAARQKGTP